MWRQTGHTIGDYLFLIAIGIFTAKLALGVGLLFPRNLRPIGIGLLLSLPLGGLLFFIGCAGSLDFR